MSPDHTIDPEMSPGQLRRLKPLGDLTDEQMTAFVSLIERVRVPIGSLIVRMHGEGNAMYLILDGEVQVSRTGGSRETALARLETGEFFGEMCLFDDEPRSANVVANRACTLLKITKQAFDSMVETHPAIAALFLRSMLRIVAGRVRKMDKMYGTLMEQPRPSSR